MFNKRKQFHNHNLVFLVLSGVGIAWDDSSDPRGRRNLARIDHDEELHEVVIDLSRATLHDVHILTSH